MQVVDQNVVLSLQKVGNGGVGGGHIVVLSANNILTPFGAFFVDLLGRCVKSAEFDHLLLKYQYYHVLSCLKDASIFDREARTTSLA